jgi:hypothetical protein
VTYFLQLGPHLLKFPASPQIVVPGREQAFSTLACGGQFIFKRLCSIPSPQRSWPFHNIKCIQSISKSPQSLHSSSIVQKSNFKVSSEGQECKIGTMGGWYMGRRRVNGGDERGWIFSMCFVYIYEIDQ